MRNRLRWREASLLGRWTSVSIWICLLLGFGALARPSFGADESAKALPPGIYAEITTPRGTMLAKLFFERAPLTVTNFVGLAEGTLGPKPGVPYYDGLTFHRVVPGFVVQGGDPAGTGEGGPGYSLPDELDPTLSHDAVGVLSMANEGPDTNGSQFFITLAPTPRLDFLHSIFGQVIQGTDVVSRIQQGDRMTVKIRREGAAAQDFRADRAHLEAWAAKIVRAESSPEAARYFADPDGLLPSSPPRAKYFGYKLSNLARFTDVRIFARVYSSLPKGLGKDSAEAMQKLTTELGIEEKGVLAVYWADHDSWDIALGKEDVGRFLAKATGEPLEERKRRLLATAERHTAEWTKEVEAKDGSIAPGQRIKLKVDGVLEELIAALEPRLRK